MVKTRSKSEPKTSERLVKQETITIDDTDSRPAADQHFEALQNQLHSKLSTIHGKRERLKKRKENLLKRRQAIFDTNAEEGNTAKRQKLLRRILHLSLTR